MGKHLRLAAALITVLVFGATLGISLADGTESLGAPSVGVASGSGIVAAGTGMFAQPATIDINVPGDVVQALLYWGDRTLNSSTPDDTIRVNGTEVTGTLIGGPTFPLPPSDVKSFAFRADVTGFGFVGIGPNMLTLTDLTVDGDEDGAGILVIFDDGTSADIQLVDGSDYANAGLNPDPPLSETVPQTFVFAPEGSDRPAEIALFVTDVTPGRTNRVNVSIDGGLVIQLDNPLASNDGDRFDTLIIPFNIPAGATSVTIDVISGPEGVGNPSSLNWIMAAFALEEEPRGGDGCTPGYWKNHLDAWGPTGLSPSDDFDAAFGVDLFDPNITLGDAIELRGGGVKKLGRHGTAALLNALHPDVNYPLTVAEVIAVVQAGDANTLVPLNELSADCPAD